MAGIFLYKKNHDNYNFKKLSTKASRSNTNLRHLRQQMAIRRRNQHMGINRKNPSTTNSHRKNRRTSHPTNIQSTTNNQTKILKPDPTTAKTITRNKRLLVLLQINRQAYQIQTRGTRHPQNRARPRPSLQSRTTSQMSRPARTSRPKRT